MRLIVGALALLSPPQDWDLVKPALLSERVEVSFLKKKTEGFSPSINLVKEQTATVLEDYLKAVRKIHEENASTIWKKLGTIETEAGKGCLTQIDVVTQWGAVRLLQMIHLIEGTAYITTAAALKEDYHEYLPIFQKIFRSFKVTSDLFSAILDKTKRESIRLAAEKIEKTLKEVPFSDQDFQKEQWQPFERTIAQEGKILGAYWQWLMLKNICGIKDAKRGIVR